MSASGPIFRTLASFLFSMLLLGAPEPASACPGQADCDCAAGCAAAAKADEAGAGCAEASAGDKAEPAACSCGAASASECVCAKNAAPSNCACAGKDDVPSNCACAGKAGGEDPRPACACPGGACAGGEGATCPHAGGAACPHATGGACPHSTKGAEDGKAGEPGAANLRAVIDPATGELTTPDAAPTARVAGLPPQLPARKGGSAVALPVPGAGVAAPLGDAFRSHAVARVDADGKVAVDCGHAAQAEQH